MKKEKILTWYIGVSGLLTLLSMVLRINLCITVGTVFFVLGVFLFSKNKAAKWTTLILVVGLNIFTSVVAGFPVCYSMPMTGYVKDKVTGEPIENAIFEIEWFENHGTVAGNVGYSIGKTYAVSGKDGKYLVGGRFTLDFINPNIDRIVRLRHPLYETIDFMPKDSSLKVLDQECLAKEKESKVFRVGTCNIRIESKNRVIPYNIKLMKLEDKYRKGLKTERGDLFISEAEDIASYYGKEAQILGVNFNWDTIFIEWEKIVKPFGATFNLARKRAMEN